MGRVLRALESALFEPATLPAAVVVAVAVLPPVVAGLVFFKLHALVALAIAAGVGGTVHALAWRFKQPAGESPALAAVLAVALVGPLTPPLWILGVALLASVLELGRARFLPAARVEAGLLAYALAFLAARAVITGYVNPGGRALAEPVRLWAVFGGGAAAPIDPIRLYVGNLPGPLFATSLMAVVIAAAWFWYARRLSLVVLATFAAGALAPALLMRWNAGFHVEQAPAWFVVALVLADRRRLPASRAARPLIGLAAGLATVAPRALGGGIKVSFLVVLGLQSAVALVEGIGWTVANRAELAARARQARDGAQLRLSARRRAA